MIERVLMGWIEAAARRAEAGDVEEGLGEEGHARARPHDTALVGSGHPHVVDDQQVGAANLVRREPAERQDVGRHPPVPGLCGQRAVVSADVPTRSTCTNGAGGRPAPARAAFRTGRRPRASVVAAVGT